MPSKSPEQHKMMEAVAHNADFAKKVHIPQSVGQDFAAADKAQNHAYSPGEKSAVLEHMAQMPDHQLRAAHHAGVSAHEMHQGHQSMHTPEAPKSHQPSSLHDHMFGSSSTMPKSDLNTSKKRPAPGQPQSGGGYGY